MTKHDIEKYSLLLLFWLLAGINAFMFVFHRVTDPTFVGLTTFVGALMVGRKGLSYWKPDKYYDYNYQQQYNYQETEEDIYEDGSDYYEI